VLVSALRDADTVRRFFRRALAVLKVTPVEVVTDAAPVYPAVLDELVPSARHHVERHANNPSRPITASSITAVERGADLAPTGPLTAARLAAYAGTTWANYATGDHGR
jgi:hypothetical protein